MSRALFPLALLLTAAAVQAAPGPVNAQGPTVSGAGAKDPNLVQAAELHREAFGLLAKAASGWHSDPFSNRNREQVLYREAVEVIGRLDVLGNKCLGARRLAQVLAIAARDNGPHDPRTMCIESCEYDAATLRDRFPSLARQRIPVPRVLMPRFTAHPMLDDAYGLHLDSLYALLHARLGRNDVDVIRLEKRLVQMQGTCMNRAPVQIKGLCIDLIATDLYALQDRFAALGNSPTAMMAAKGRARGKLLKKGTKHAGDEHPATSTESGSEAGAPPMPGAAPHPGAEGR